MATVEGIIQNVSGSKVCNSGYGYKKTLQDYYNLFLKTKDGKIVKIYFPVFSSNRYAKKKNIISMIKDGRSFEHELMNPKTIINHAVKITGFITKNDDGTFHMNNLQSFEIFLDE